ncbi:ABC transporter ATP-binding protein [Bacteriovoracaceae bacterium]|nr:ABC transporter ATP-binding protein [Bacteriovoracaceae bacterium]
MRLIAKDINKSFMQGENPLEVLKNLSFEIEGGTNVASIIGKSGSGKSTLLSVLSGIMSPDKGELVFGDRAKSSFSSDQEFENFRKNNLGIIFQQFHLIESLNALENVLLPLKILKKDDALKTANKWMDQVGLSERKKHLPYQLSGGEQQRVAIARTMAMNLNIIFADEPTGNLDEETGGQLIDDLFKLVKNENKLLILVTHDKDLASRANKRFSLEQGQLKVLQ